MSVTHKKAPVQGLFSQCLIFDDCLVELRKDKGGILSTPAKIGTDLLQLFLFDKFFCHLPQIVRQESEKVSETNTVFQLATSPGDPTFPGFLFHSDWGVQRELTVPLAVVGVLFRLDGHLCLVVGKLPTWATRKETASILPVDGEDRCPGDMAVFHIL